MALRIARLNETPDEDHQDLFKEYVAARQAFDQAERHLKILTEALAAEMAEKHQKSFKQIDNEGKVRTVTFVQNQNIKIDEKGLRRALTAKVYDKFTVKKLDRKALEDAIGTEIDPMVVSKYVTTEPGRPYLRYTEKDATDDEQA